MKAKNTNWSKNEAEVYLKLFAGSSLNITTKEKMKLFASGMNKNRFRELHTEFSFDNDYECIQKILYNIKKYGYTKPELFSLIQKIKMLFIQNSRYKSSDMIRLLSLKRLILN